jgi:hypothetical protein
MATSFSVDSRLPIPDDMDLSDPSHPRNVTRNAIMVQQQAKADTKYDPQPPARIYEGFQSGILAVFLPNYEPHPLLVILCFFVLFAITFRVVIPNKRYGTYATLVGTIVVAMYVLQNNSNQIV